MAGAIIPDDWDGSTFECLRVIWPSSQLWTAILLGQMTEPSREAYWDPDTGDEEEAAVAAQDAYRLTTPDIYTEECDVTPGIPVPIFKVNKTVTQSIPASTWTPITWQAREWDLNSPEFTLIGQGHAVVNPDHFGLWHYSVILNVIGFSQIFMRSIISPSLEVIAATSSASGLAELSFEWVWEGAGDTIRVELFSTLADDIDITMQVCLWTGYFVGPTEEL